MRSLLSVCSFVYSKRDTFFFFFPLSFFVRPTPSPFSTVYDKVGPTSPTVNLSLNFLLFFAQSSLATGRWGSVVKPQVSRVDPESLWVGTVVHRNESTHRVWGVVGRSGKGQGTRDMVDWTGKNVVYCNERMTLLIKVRWFRAEGKRQGCWRL